jgi:hypothetical protein
MKYVIDRKNNTEKVYSMNPLCEHCMFEFDETAPMRDCEGCVDCKKENFVYKEISSGKIGMAFLEFISTDFEKIEKELVELFYQVEHSGIEAAINELEKYLDKQPYYIKLLNIHQSFYFFIEHADRIADFESIENSIEVSFSELILIQKIISAYADDKYFIEPSVLLQAFNEYMIMFIPSVYTPDFRDNFSEFEENPIKTLKKFEKECSKKRGDTYEFTNFRQMFGVSFDWIVTNGYKISRCENCGKFFVPYGRYDTRYCPYPHKNGKSCRELSFEITLDNNKVLKEYRKIYKTKHAWMNRNKVNRPNVEKEFAKWHKAAKAMVDKFKLGAVSEMECLKWLNDNK